MANLTPSQFAEKLQQKLNSFKNENKPFAIAVFDTHAKAAQRIFENGLATDNSKIGTYDSTTPIYINPDDSPKKFATQGKGGKKTKLNGKGYKTRYFSGYREFRNIIGSESSFVNLSLFGNLRSNFRGGITKENANKYTVTLRGENGDKSFGLESKYGAIFSLTESEKENIIKINRLELIRELNA